MNADDTCAKNIIRFVCCQSHSSYLSLLLFKMTFTLTWVSESGGWLFKVSLGNYRLSVHVKLLESLFPSGIFLS